MCGACGNEPIASYQTGDVVSVVAPEHGVPVDRIGRVGDWDREFGLRVDWPSDEPPARLGAENTHFLECI